MPRIARAPVTISPRMDPDVTQILAAIDDGDPRAAQDLLPIVYNELRRLASQRMARDAPNQTLSPTALVHEAYVRLVGDDRARAPQWDSRGHFFAAAAEAMRRILIDRARARRSQKRGGDRQGFELNPADLTLDTVPDELIDLDEALAKFAAEDPVKAEVVKLRFFAGLSLEEVGEILRLSRATVERHWIYARAWLFDALRHGRGTIDE